MKNQTTTLHPLFYNRATVTAISTAIAAEDRHYMVVGTRAGMPSRHALRLNRAAQQAWQNAKACLRREGSAAAYLSDGRRIEK